MFMANDTHSCASKCPLSSKYLCSTLCIDSIGEIDTQQLWEDWRTHNLGHGGALIIVFGRYTMFRSIEDEREN